MHLSRVHLTTTVLLRKDFAMVLGFFWIPKEIQKNETVLLAVDPNFDGDFYDFVSFLTLFWARHLSIIFKLLNHIIRGRGL